jgi:hypothetical protein
VVRKVIVDEFMTLDGVVQGHGAAAEDNSGGFANGGWHMRYFGGIAWQWQVEHLSAAGGLLLGRRTAPSWRRRCWTMTW